MGPGAHRLKCPQKWKLGGDFSFCDWDSVFVGLQGTGCKHVPILAHGKARSSGAGRQNISKYYAWGCYFK